MEPEYDEQGNIPGPTNDSPIHSSEQGLINAKKLAWEGFKWAVPGGSIADVFFDQDKRGDLKFTQQPQVHQLAHPAIQLVAQKAGSEFFNTRITPHRPLPSTGAITKNKPVDEKTGADILDKIFKWKRFSNNTITERERLLKAGEGRNDPTVYISPDEVAEMGLNEPLQSTIRQGAGESKRDYTTRYWNTKFDELGIPEDVRFNLREMLDSDHLTKAQRRNIKSGISNPNYTFKDYKEMRTVLVDDFLDGLEDFGIDPSTIEIHHISSLRHVSQLFEGLERSQWPQMLNEIYNAGLATGNDPDNLMPMQAKAHRSGSSSNVDSVHQYLDNELGKYNERITGDFGDEIRELSVEERIPFIKRYAEIRQSSLQVANNAIRQVLDETALNREGGMDALLDNIVLSKDQLNYVQSEISKHIELQLTRPNWEALSDSITDDISAAEALKGRGLSPSGPTQDQLFDLGKKESNKKNNKGPSGPGAYWDIESE